MHKHKLIHCVLPIMCAGVDGQFTVTIVSSPAGTPVSGSTNTFDYPILSSVNLTCNVTSNNMSSFTVDSYQWNTTECYTHPNLNGGNPRCFPHSQNTQDVSSDNLLAEDAGTITCTVTISGSNYTSEPFTLRISGEQLVYCVIACIVYCKQCMLLLLATCYCCIIHQLLWFMYRGVFTVGIALIGVMYDSDDILISNAIISANVLNDYSYVNARDGTISGNRQIARCVTGLGPSASDDNNAVGGLVFNGTIIRNGRCSDSFSAIIQPQPAGLNNLGVINIQQCREFSTSVEGVYSCTMMNSSMMNESIRFGVYFTGRSESLDLYIPSLIYLSSLYTAAPLLGISSTIIAVIGSSLTLSCTSQGSPPDTFTWRKDNDPTVLQSTSISAVDYTNTSAVFRADYSIDSVTTSNNGTYTCTVTNPIGSDNTTITVVVGKLPVVIFDNIVGITKYKLIINFI